MEKKIMQHKIFLLQGSSTTNSALLVYPASPEENQQMIFSSNTGMYRLSKSK